MSIRNLPATQAGAMLRSEIYNRGADGQLSPRIGFLSEILSTINPRISININFDLSAISTDVRAIKNKLDSLPVELAKRQLNVNYTEITKCLENYLAYEDKDLLNKLFELCQAASPGFEQCIREQSGCLNPFSDNWNYKNNFDVYLDEFQAICDAYATVLGVYLYSAAQLYRNNIAKETSIKGHLIQICETLESLVSRVVTKNGSFDSESLLVKSLFETDNLIFERYFKYSGLPPGVAGFKEFLARANRNTDRYAKEINIKASNSHGPGNFNHYNQDLRLVDQTIELLLSFKAVFNERMNFEVSEIDKASLVNLS